MAVLIRHAEGVAAQPVTSEGAQGVGIRRLIGREDPGATNFMMRRFEVAPGGHTPRHRHPWEHEVYVLAGRGAVEGPAGPQPIRAGDAVLVPADEEHRFANTGPGPLTFLCLVPVAAARA